MGFLAVATGEKAEMDVRAMALRMGHRERGRLAARPRISRTRVRFGRAAGRVPVAFAGTFDGGLADTGAESVTGFLDVPGVPAVSLPGDDLPEGEPAVLYCDGHPPDAFAIAAAWDDGTLFLVRGPLGLRPLYYLERDGRPVAFASEMKALCPLGKDIRTFPPGHAFVNGRFIQLTNLADWGSDPLRDPKAAAGEVARIIEDAVRRGYESWLDSLGDESGAADAPPGVFLSGGIDSSVVAAAAASTLGPERLMSFAVGTSGSADLPQARLVADHLGIRHTERIFGEAEVSEVLPDVIYHLESFDAPLVRSSVANYLVAGMAADAGCRLAYCGEGGDELFAGYSYLKDIRPRGRVADELLTLLEGGHANGFQRVDRMMSAHGLEARVPLSAPELVAFSFRVPIEWKLHPETGQEKWLLREAFQGRLPESIIDRPKAKFYEGSGIEDLMTRVAEAEVSDADFEREHLREAAPGLVLETKEEMLYYRIFCEHFPHGSLLDTIGWTRTVKD